MTVDSKMMMDAAILSVREPNSATAASKAFRELTTCVEKFSNVAFSKIRSVNSIAKTRGLTYNFEGNKILTYCVAGRIMVTLRCSKDRNLFVSLVGAEEASRFSPNSGNAGLQGVYGELEDVLELLNWFAENWERIEFEETADVSMI